MKIILTEEQVKKLIKEKINDNDDFFSLYNEIEYDVFYSIKNKRKIVFNLINPSQYKRALDEFMKYGQFVRFPENLILDWKELCLNNIILLTVLTEINGHGEHFPFDTFYDIFDKLKIPKKHQYNWGYVYEILDKKFNIDDYIPFFTNGHAVLSDYGIEPLHKLARTLISQSKPEEIIITINKIMDVAHQRSDLSELFLEGGQASHYMISNT